MHEAPVELVTVKVLRKEGIRGIKLVAGTTVQLPDHIVEELLDMRPPPIRIIGQRGCIGRRQPMKQPLQNSTVQPPVPPQRLFTFTKLPPRGEG